MANHSHLGLEKMGEYSMHPEVKMFSLRGGDKFILNNKKYEIITFRRVNVARLGKTLRCETMCEGKRQYFLRDWPVKPIEVEENDNGN